LEVKSVTTGQTTDKLRKSPQIDIYALVIKFSTILMRC